MNNRLPLIVIGLVILILAAGGLFFLTQSNKQSTQPAPVTSEQVQPQTQQISDQKSMKDLMGMQNQQCAFSDSESKSSGRVYAGGGKFRGDFSFDANGQPMLSHMISDGKDFYMWTDGQKDGFKMTIEKLEQPQADNTAMDINKRLDYKCENWVVDSSMFVLPKDIKFAELPVMKAPTSATGSGTSGGANIKSQQCAACDTLTGDAKDQCRKALSCN